MPLLLAIVLYGLGAVVLGGMVYALWYGHASRSWPTAEGRIIQSRLRQAERTGGRRGYGYSVTIRYEYEVDGRRHIGSRVGFCRLGSGSGSFVRKKMSRLIKKYPEGATVPVHYHPSNPNKAVLETGVGDRLAFTIGIAMMVVFLATATFLLFKTLTS